MTVYYVKRFNAVIVAYGRTQALSLLSKELKDKKQFSLSYKDINPTEFVQLDTSSTHVVLLDYEEIHESRNN